MELTLDGKTAIVTGGSRGIGLGIAKAFHDAGANVMLTSRKAEGLQTAIETLGGGERLHSSPAHVANPEDAERIIGETIAHFGSVDVLVNNAATNPHAGPMIECDLGRLDKTWEVNLRAPFAWTQHAYNAWMKEHGGSVINISSSGSFQTSAALGVYCMLKAGLNHMTKQLAAELGPKVRVNAIAPGLIKTDFARVLWEGERGKQVAQMYPMKRLGEPSDIGNAALWLAAGASWVTGITLPVEGGELVSVQSEMSLTE